MNHFCPNCESLYIIIRKDDNLKYYCEECKTESENSVDSLVYSKHYDKKFISSNIQLSAQNEHIIHDNTLPRVNNIKCINSDCITHSEGWDPEKNEVLYLRYNNTELKYIYVCGHCFKTWNNE